MGSFAPEVIFHLGRFPITNTVIDTILVDGFLLLLAFATNRSVALYPGKLQTLMEIIIGGLHKFNEDIALERTKQIFPYFATFFLFILFTNWSGLIPGINTFGIYETTKNGRELIPFIKPASSDLNFTLGLAIISLVATHILSIKTLGVTQYLSRFFAFVPFLVSVFKGKPKININFRNPMDIVIGIITPFVMVFVGFLELISEFVKGVSLSFRLFGNIYAGEVVLKTVSGIFAFIFPIPFLSLELVVGVVQALVFAMLTMVFMVILTTPHHEESKEVTH